MRQEHTPFISRRPEDFRVWEPFQPAVAQVDGIVSKRHEERRRCRRNAHVRQELHTGARSTG